MNLPPLLRGRQSAGLLAALGTLAAISALSAWTLNQLERDTQSRNISNVTLLQLQELMRHLVDAETGQRGYLLSAEEQYLDPYDSAVAEIDRDLGLLRALRNEDSTLPLSLDRLTPLVDARLELIDSIVRLQRIGREEAARALVLTDSGKRVMDDLRREVGQISARLEDMRRDRSARVAAATRRARWTMIAIGLATATLLAAAGVLSIRQATARSRAERELAASREHLNAILDALPVGVFVVDGSGRPYYANRVSRELLGKGLVDAGAVDLPDVYQAYVAGTERLYPGEQQPIVAALHGKDGHADDIEIRRPDRSVPIEVWAAPVHDRDRRLVFAVAAFSDITERKRAAERIAALNSELARQVSELEAVNKELETFSYSVSHDLRAPLRAIDGFSRILIEDHGAHLDREAHRLIGVIREKAQHMGRLIDDLLQLSRLTRMDLAVTPLDMTALVRTVIEDQRVATEGKPTEIVIGTLPAARGDPTLLRQVWANLVGNALKYSGSQSASRVEIGGRMEDDHVVYWVRDNGVGFDMRYADKLFGVFQRLHGREFEGTGVGLATVQRAVHRHGGRVWAEGEPHRGATFYFTLPRGA